MLLQDQNLAYVNKREVIRAFSRKGVWERPNSKNISLYTTDEAVEVQGSMSTFMNAATSRVQEASTSFFPWLQEKLSGTALKVIWWRHDLTQKGCETLFSLVLSRRPLICCKFLVLSPGRELMTRFFITEFSCICKGLEFYLCNFQFSPHYLAVW